MVPGREASTLARWLRDHVPASRFLGVESLTCALDGLEVLRRPDPDAAEGRTKAQAECGQLALDFRRHHGMYGARHQAPRSKQAACPPGALLQTHSSV